MAAAASPLPIGKPPTAIRRRLGDDHDNDGVSNGVEYFLGGNTDTTGFTALPGVTNTGGTLSVTWTKAASYTGTYGTDFVVETSATLRLLDHRTTLRHRDIPRQRSEIHLPRRHHQLRPPQGHRPQLSP